MLLSNNNHKFKKSSNMYIIMKKEYLFNMYDNNYLCSSLFVQNK